MSDVSSVLFGARDTLRQAGEHMVIGVLPKALGNLRPRNFKIKKLVRSSKRVPNEAGPFDSSSFSASRNL